MIPERASERFISGASGLSVLAILCIVPALDGLPFAFMWLAETPFFLGAFAAMTLYKRNRWGWLWTGFVAVVSFAEPIAYFIPAIHASQTTGALIWSAGALIGIGWFCMIHLERHRRPVELPVQHMVNHHVFHGLPAVGPAYGAEAFPIPRGAADRTALHPGPSRKAIAAVPVWGATARRPAGRRVMATVGRGVRNIW